MLDEKKRQELLERMKDDFQFFAENALYIIDKKTNKLIRFKLNKIQKTFLYLEDRFNFVIKSRKGGISTLRIGQMIWKCAFRKNQKEVLLCQNEDATSKMFRERVIPMIKNCIYPINCKIKESSGIIDFVDMFGTLYIGTAGSKSFGRGSDITGFHLSEYAHWEDAKVLTGIEEALMEGATGTIETTAKGINFAHNLWKKCVALEARYKAIFIPWFFDEVYKIDSITTLPDLTLAEKELVNAFDLTPAQLAWRRQKIKDMSDPEMFPQEYPATAEEAFISSGKMVFDWIALKKHEKNCIPPKAKGFLKDEGPKGIKFEIHSTAGLQIWEFPRPERNYIIGGDVAEGIAGENYSTACVIDLTTMAQVAEYHGHMLPDDFGDFLEHLGYYYNTALVAPESWPGVGGVTIARLIKLEYPNLYMRDRKKNSARSDVQLYGWSTNTESRPLMIHGLGGSGIRDFGMVIRSAGLLDELRSFVYDEVNPNKMDHQKGCFSDRVFAAGIAYYIAKEKGLDEREEHRGITNFRNKGRGNCRNNPAFTGPRYGVRKSTKGAI